MADTIQFVNIYTDGACSGNQSAKNYGGWGAILEYGQHKKEASGGEINTTNNRMELSALISALDMLTRDGLNIRVFSDSSYLIRCMNEKWYENWKSNGWKNASKKPVENQDLWERILEHLPKHQFKFYNVKGHINLNSKNTNIEVLYGKFTQKNGKGFTKDEFVYIVEMNNRADALANEGIDSVRE
jgi:ribonuclease HI